MGAHCAPLRKMSSTLVPWRVSALQISPCPHRKGVIHTRVDTFVSTLLCPRRVGTLPAEVQRKNPPPVRGEHADAVRVPRSAGAEKQAAARKGRTVHTVRAHRKVCAEKSSLEKRTPISSPDVFPCAMPQNALYLFYMT